MNIQPIKTSVFQEGEKLLPFIIKYIPHIKDKSIIVVTSKIVALAEKRTAILTEHLTKEMLIKQESELAILTKHTWLTIKDGIVMPAAGIDESNANGKIILLPKDSHLAAKKLRVALKKHYNVKNLGILITDSRTLPLRAGVTGVALGYAGFKGLKSYEGTPDLFGRKFKYSRVDVADSLATAAGLMMGEGREQQPLAVIENTSVTFCERVHRRELHIDIQDDMYQPLFIHLNTK